MADFKLQLYFAILHEYNDLRWGHSELCGATILSYLILPSVQSEIITAAGPGVVSYLSSTFVNPSITQEPTREHVARFETAMRVLRLCPTVSGLQRPATWPTSQPRPENVPTDTPKLQGSQASSSQVDELEATAEVVSVGEVGVLEEKVGREIRKTKQPSEANVPRSTFGERALQHVSIKC